jgi:hypothetical protein
MEENFGPGGLSRTAGNASAGNIRERGLMRILSAMLLAVGALALAPLSARAQAPGGASTPAARGETAPPPRSFEDPSAPAGWKRYELQFDAGNVMSVLMPPPSEATKSGIPGAEGAVGYAYVAVTPTDVYVVGYLTGLPALATRSPEMRATLFGEFWRGFATGLKESMKRNGLEVELVSQPVRKTRVGAFEGQEQEFAIGKMPGTALAVISGGYAHVVIAVSLGERPGDEHKSFLKSFSLRARR